MSVVHGIMAAVTDYDSLHSAAGWAREVLGRVSNIADQIASGLWDDDLTPDQARDLADSLRELAEAARASRSAAGSAKVNVEPGEPWRGPLPFNRKERFFTGTVFPGLVGATGYWHLQRALDLFGVPVRAEVGGSPEIQFITEYGFAESVYTDDDKAKWGTDFTRETPDIVLAGPDWLLAIEAKMFHNPTADALNAQMSAQRPLVECWQQVLGMPTENVVHALLLPERLARRERAGLTDQVVVTWENILDAYRHVAPPYWVSVLAEALDRHEELESKFTESFQPNAENVMTGQAIVDAWRNDALTIGYVGRRNGLHGPEFTHDVAEGTWAAQRYQVRSEPIVAKNWFTVADFLEAVAGGV